MNKNANGPPIRNVLYFSKFTEMCRDLLKLMHEYNVLSQFYLYCTDGIPIEKLPANLDRVPTLVISGINKPLIGREAIEWFKVNRFTFIQNNEQLQYKKIMYNMMKTMQSETGPRGFSNIEHAGLSDAFAYTDIDFAQPKVYCNYGEDNSEIKTPEINENKITESAQKKLLKMEEQDRNKQDKEIATLIKHTHVDVLMNKEKEQFFVDRLGI